MGSSITSKFNHFFIAIMTYKFVFERYTLPSIFLSRIRGRVKEQIREDNKDSNNIQKIPPYPPKHIRN